MSLGICKNPWNQHSKQNIEDFHYPESSFMLSSSRFYPIPKCNHLLTSIINLFCLFLHFTVIESSSMFCACVNVLSLNVSEIHPCCCTYQWVLLFTAKYCPITWLCHNLFTHSLLEGHLSFPVKSCYEKSCCGYSWVSL